MLDALKKIKPQVGSLDEIAQSLADTANQKTLEVLAQINLLLHLLQSAGYGIDNLEIALNFPPKVIIKLKTGPAVSEEKLVAIVRDQADKKVITTIVSSLIQANKLRNSITVETLQLDEIEVVLTTSPNITLSWKDREKAKGEANAA